MAQDESNQWVWRTDGKRWTRTEECLSTTVALPTTMTEVVPYGEQKDGDSWRMKYMGKTMTREYTRECPLPEVVLGTEHRWRFHTVGKRTVREDYFVVDGVEQSTPDRPASRVVQTVE